MIFNILLDELVTEFELKVRARGWIILSNRRSGVCGCLICVSFVLQDPSLISGYPTDRRFAFTVSMTVIVSTTNVNWRRSWCWYSVSFYSRLIIFSYTDATLVGELLSMLRYLKRMKYYKFTRCLQVRDLLECILVHQEAYDSSWFQWASTVWMEVILSLKDSRHGLSSIYNFVHHIEQNATFGTVGHCKVLRKNTVTFQPMLILPEFFLSSSSLHVLKWDLRGGRHTR